MKKIVLLAVFAILAFGAKAQIKVHNNGRITFLTLNNTVSEGIAFSPGTNSNADFNTDCYFKNNAYYAVKRSISINSSNSNIEISNSDGVFFRFSDSFQITGGFQVDFGGEFAAIQQDCPDDDNE